MRVCLVSRSSDHTPETDRRNQMNQLPATRRERVPYTCVLMDLSKYYLVGSGPVWPAVHIRLDGISSCPDGRNPHAVAKAWQVKFRNVSPLGSTQCG